MTYKTTIIRSALWYNESKKTVKYMLSGLNKTEITQKATQENIYQVNTSVKTEKSYFYVYRNNFFNYRLNINFAIIVITGSDINVRTINNTNKSFNLSGISDFNITAPVSVKYIN